jgi:hypothetical protein
LQILKAVHNNELPFGGVHMIVVGDFCQLDPIPKEGSPFLKPAIGTEAKLSAIGYKAYRTLDMFMPMVTNMRQDKDGEDEVQFRQTLQRIRVGHASSDDQLFLAVRAKT